MIIPTFKGKIEDNKLIINNGEKYREHLLFLNGREVEVIVRKPKRTRTIPQQKYYFGVVLKVISDHTGEEVEDLHDHFSFKWLRKHGKSGKLMCRRSTTTLDTVEMTRYIDKIIMWAGQSLEISIPKPNEIEYDGVNNYIRV